MAKKKLLNTIGIANTINLQSYDTNIQNCYGFKELFYVVVNAICGYLMSDYIPNTITLYQMPKNLDNPTDWNTFYQENNSSINTISNTIYITGLTPVNTYPNDTEFDSLRDKYSVSFTATIPFSQLINSLINNIADPITNYKYLVVLFSKNKTALAYFELDSALLAQLVPGSQLLVNWYLYFENFNETGENV